MKDKKLFAARVILTVLTVAAVAAIFGHSMMNADDSSAESGFVLNLINGIFRALGIPVTADEFVVRKLAHFTEFAVLGALLSVTVYLYLFRRWKAFRIALPVGLLVAACDEWIQTMSKGRSSQFTDVLIDFSGVLFAALIVQLILYLIHRHKVKKEGNGIE